MAGESIYKAFGRGVATRRKELELTQAELAARVGISRASVANIESGRQNVLLHHVYGLARALEFSTVSELLPSLPKSEIREDFEMVLSDETVTQRGKAQISELIMSALADRATKRSES